MYLHTDNSCYESCLSGYFGNSTINECMSCSSDCDGCTLAATNCIKCASGKFKQIGSNNCGSCPDGYYGSTVSNYCTLCETGCKTCNSSLVCTSCKSVAGVNYYLDSNKCLPVCSLGKYGDNTGTAPVCTNCTSICGSCISLTACLSCATGYVLLYGQQTCQSSCLLGQYNDGARRCQKCEFNCLSCTN